MIRSWIRDCGPAWLVGGALALLAGFVVAPAIVPYFVPMSSMYELRTLAVAEETPQGTSPRIAVDRVIHRDFRGRFEVEILRVEGSEFSVWRECGPHESNWFTYRATASVRPNADLDWWMDIPPNRECELPPGLYKVLTTVYGIWPFGAVLSTTNESNVFRVTPGGKD